MAVGHTLQWVANSRSGVEGDGRVAKPPEEATGHGSTPAMRRCHIVHLIPLLFFINYQPRKIAVTLVFINFNFINFQIFFFFF